ncbi:MAG: transcription elongation GreA/GreB family factor [Psychroserpens sp.]|jgi:transcription elongation GreA/GreB family factor|uniref:transcription elongation factor n=1 Tax=Psychroserpens sp. TaxID=2020870 RepID=UPI0039E6F128
MSSIKSQLLEVCFTHVNKRIANYKNELETIKDSIENNDKGDEENDSGNGKLFNDLEKNAQYLSDASKMLDTLKTINSKAIHQNAVLGSLITTDISKFYLAVSIGKIEIDNENYFIISKSSPIGELLLNKTVGESITFNNTTYNIKEIR